jgi:hypothetical protein
LNILVTDPPTLKAVLKLDWSFIGKGVFVILPYISLVYDISLPHVTWGGGGVIGALGTGEGVGELTTGEGAGEETGAEVTPLVIKPVGTQGHLLSVLHGVVVDAGAGEHLPPLAAGVVMEYVVVWVPDFQHVVELQGLVVGDHTQSIGGLGSWVLLLATIAKGRL